MAQNKSNDQPEDEVVPVEEAQGRRGPKKVDVGSVIFTRQRAGNQIKPQIIYRGPAPHRGDTVVFTVDGSRGSGGVGDFAVVGDEVMSEFDGAIAAEEP